MTAMPHRCVATPTHILANPYTDVWILSARNGQFIRAVHAPNVHQATALIGAPADSPNHHWVRRGPGRHSYVPIEMWSPGERVVLEMEK